MKQIKATQMKAEANILNNRDKHNTFPQIATETEDLLWTYFK